MRIRAKVEVTNGLTAYAYKDVELDDLSIVKIGQRYDLLKSGYLAYLEKNPPYLSEESTLSFEDWVRKGYAEYL